MNMDSSSTTTSVPSSSSTPITVSRYTILGHSGKGSFGTVSKARDLITSQVVALKSYRISNGRVPLHQIHREISLMLFCNHSTNTLPLLSVLRTRSEIFLVTPYMVLTLHEFIHAKQSRNKLSRIPSKAQLIRDLLRGTAHLHDQSIVHRDLKPENILLESSGVLKIADFGHAIMLLNPGHDKLDDQKGTLWYRAPEVLLGWQYYDTSVDVWSIGCTMAELSSANVLFEGNNERDQVARIVEVRGWEEWPEAGRFPFGRRWLKLVKGGKVRLRRQTLGMKEDAFRLCERLLQVRPQKRVSARDALEDEWFLKIPGD